MIPANHIALYTPKALLAAENTRALSMSSLRPSYPAPVPVSMIVLIALLPRPYYNLNRVHTGIKGTGDSVCIVRKAVETR